MPEVEETNGGGKALCISHGERLSKVEEAILDISQAVQRIEAKVDHTPESLKQLLTSDEWAQTGAAALVQTGERLATLVLERGATTANGWTGRILALAVLVATLAGSGMAVRYGELIVGAQAASEANAVADTSPDGD